MNSSDQQLVQRIAEQVIEQMSSDDRRADVHPPIGVCTGDYSQFTDRPDLVQSSDAAPTAAADRTFTGFVTAKQIMDAGVTTVRLGPGARLTPLAADHVRQAQLRVERVDTAGSAHALVAPASATWHWWIDGHCDAVRQLTGARREQLSPLTPQGKPSALADVVKRMAQAVRGGRAAGGFLFVQSAANAACYANRCSSLRAVVGTCGEAVQQGIELLAANVLIIEYPHHGPKAMNAMIEQFIEATRPDLPGVDRQLRELSTCA